MLCVQLRSFVALGAMRATLKVVKLCDVELERAAVVAAEALLA
jgi:hypothetical protein